MQPTSHCRLAVALVLWASGGPELVEAADSSPQHIMGSPALDACSCSEGFECAANATSKGIRDRGDASRCCIPRDAARAPPMSCMEVRRCEYSCCRGSKLCGSSGICCPLGSKCGEGSCSGPAPPPAPAPSPAPSPAPAPPAPVPTRAPPAPAPPSPAPSPSRAQILQRLLDLLHDLWRLAQIWQVDVGLAALVYACPPVRRKLALALPCCRPYLCLRDDSARAALLNESDTMFTRMRRRAAGLSCSRRYFPCLLPPPDLDDGEVSMQAARHDGHADAAGSAGSLAEEDQTAVGTRRPSEALLLDGEPGGGRESKRPRHGGDAAAV